MGDRPRAAAEDQRWTLARIKTVIGRRFRLAFTIRGVRKLLVRSGWSCQVPARGVMGRDDDAVTRWVQVAAAWDGSFSEVPSRSCLPEV